MPAVEAPLGLQRFEDLVLMREGPPPIPTGLSAVVRHRNLRPPQCGRQLLAVRVRVVGREGRVRPVGIEGGPELADELRVATPDSRTFHLPSTNAERDRFELPTNAVSNPGGAGTTTPSRAGGLTSPHR